MNCPSCRAGMTALTLDSHLRIPIVIDVCPECQAFWFDRHESLQLSPASTLELMQFIGEHAPSGAPPAFESLTCPRCAEALLKTRDLQRNTRFHYWRCGQGHGRFIRFFEFLREKNFIRPLSAEQLDELRRNVAMLNCSNCGAPIDLMTASACAHCLSPITMLDMQQPQRMIEQLRQAAAPRPVDPDLPLRLARARREVETSFGPVESNPDWWRDASSSGLVQAGLNAVARRLRNAGTD